MKNNTKPLISKFVAPLIAVSSAFLLAVIKAIVGWLSGSLTLIGSALDSFLDTISSTMNYIFIKKADAPPDEEHPFGHGKLEAYASFIQSVVIFGTGCFLILESLKRIKTKVIPEVGLSAFVVMVISIIVSLALTLMLRHVAKREGSQALKADAAHYSVDLLVNAGVIITLLLIKLTGLHWVDPLIASILAVYIMAAAVRLHLSALRILLDRRIDKDKLKNIEDILHKYTPYDLDFHDLRTRTDGYKIFIDVHLTLCDDFTLSEAHEICDLIEEELQKKYDDLDITIHPEPCFKPCTEKCNKENVKKFFQEVIEKHDQPK